MFNHFFKSMKINVLVASEKHTVYAEAISKLISEASHARGTGIANRSADYIAAKIMSGHAVIALAGDDLAGFCYIETWEHKKYVANSGLVVADRYRKQGLARRIKEKAFRLSRQLYPQAKLFGITTSLPVMKINTALGYRPVTFAELTDDRQFWQGCQGCRNYDILERNNFGMCLCTGMLFDPLDTTNGKLKHGWGKLKKMINPIKKKSKNEKQ